MKKILLILTIIALPSMTYAGSDCEVVKISLYDDVRGHVSSLTHMFSGGTRSCATVTVENTSRGGRFNGKITAIFMDGKTKTKSFKSERLSQGERATTKICWSKKSELESMECEF